MRVMRSSTPASNATAVRRLRTESGTRASVRSGEVEAEGADMEAKDQGGHCGAARLAGQAAATPSQGHFTLRCEDGHRCSGSP